MSLLQPGEVTGARVATPAASKPLTNNARVEEHHLVGGDANCHSRLAQANDSGADEVVDSRRVGSGLGEEVDTHPGGRGSRQHHFSWTVATADQL